MRIRDWSSDVCSSDHQLCRGASARRFVERAARKDRARDSGGADTRERLTVELGARSYDILIGDGLLADIGAQVAPLLNRRRTMIVTDAHVAGPYLDRVSATLVAAGVSVSSLVLPAGEGPTGWEGLARLTRSAEPRGGKGGFHGGKSGR